MTYQRFKKITHKTFAGFMAIWLSGVVFLFCCEKINGESMEPEFCPMAKMSEHCDKAAKVNADSAVVEHLGEECVDCCGFLPVVFDKARKVEQTKKQLAVTPKATAQKFQLPTLTDNSHPITALHSRLPDRQATFVKNCVFRI